MTDTHTWYSLKNMAIRQRRRGQHEAAVASLEKAFAVVRDDGTHLTEAATILNYLADLLLEMGRLKEAEATVREALQRTVQEPWFYADNLLILGKILLGQGRDKEAAKTRLEGMRLVRREYGTNHPYTLALEAESQAKGAAISKSA